MKSPELIHKLGIPKTYALRSEGCRMCLEYLWLGNNVFDKAGMRALVTAVVH